jgi:hypothetical protein
VGGGEGHPTTAGQCGHGDARRNRPQRERTAKKLQGDATDVERGDVEEVPGKSARAAKRGYRDGPRLQNRIDARRRLLLLLQVYSHECNNGAGVRAKDKLEAAFRAFIRRRPRMRCGLAHAVAQVALGDTRHGMFVWRRILFVVSQPKSDQHPMHPQPGYFLAACNLLCFWRCHSKGIFCRSRGVPTEG